MVDEDLIVKLYSEEEMSFHAISTKLGLPQSSIYPILYEKGIVRSLSEAQHVRYGWSQEKIENHKKPIDASRLYQLYVIEKKGINHIARILVTHDRRVAARLEELGIPIRSRGEALHVSAAKRDSHKKLWRNKEFKRMQSTAMAAGRNGNPSHGETLLYENFLQVMYPNRFGMNCNGEIERLRGLYFEGKHPDFISLDGEKQIILYNGCYWHCCEQCGNGDIILLNGKTAKQVREDDVRVLEICEDLEYSVLVIWEHEMGDTAEVTIKIRDFIEG